MGIEFRRVEKTYSDGTQAVRDVSFAVPSHTTTVLLGSSGCGKTTLLRMVNRMVDPTAGQVHIDGEDIAAAAPVQLRRSIGYVMQHSGLLPHRRVVDNVATGLRLNGARRGAARSQAEELLELVGLDPALGSRYPDQLSGGQQQRVGVARGLAGDPNILLMDEPFGAVDPLVRQELQHQMRRLQSELRKTVLFVTHDIEEALSLGDQIIVLRPGGEIAQVGTAQELVSAPADDFVARFVGLVDGRRRLRTSPGSEGEWVVSDAEGRPLGVVEAPQADPAERSGTPGRAGTYERFESESR